MNCGREKEEERKVFFMKCQLIKVLIEDKIKSETVYKINTKNKEVY